MYWLEWSSQRRSEIISGVLCLGLSAALGCSKTHGSALGESPCYCFFPKRWLNLHLFSSCEDRGLPLSWYTAYFSTSTAACSLLWEEKGFYLFIFKSAMPCSRSPSKEAQLRISFSLGLGLCFFRQAVLRLVIVHEEYARTQHKGWWGQTHVSSCRISISNLQKAEHYSSGLGNSKHGAFLVSSPTVTNTKGISCPCQWLVRTWTEQLQ